MRLSFSVIIAVTYTVVAIASPFSKRTVSTVEQDIAAISISLAGLDNTIHNFPSSGGTLVQALSIHTALTSLDNEVSQATADILATCPFSEADATTILESVEAFGSVLVDVFSALIAKLPAFQSLPIGGVPALIKQDISTICAELLVFENALFSCVPADLEPVAEKFQDAIDSACSRAILAYSHV